jgi:hypothetical protein
MAEQEAEIRSQDSGVRSQEPEVRSPKPAGESQRQQNAGKKTEVSDAGSDDAGEDAEVAAQSEPNRSPETNVPPPPPDDDGYVWPEGAEAASETLAPAAAAEAASAPLPSLDEMVQRIPPDVRETFDDLFRGKFVSAKRVSRGSLK